jgi:tetratricopeptide (TPR) repeat protein
MSTLSAAVHRAILCVDVEQFGDPRRTHPHQATVRKGLYTALRTAFARSGVSWTDCYHEDRGDGALILVPPDVPKNLLAVNVPRALAAALAEHNRAHDRQSWIRLRLAVHAGEIHSDDYGVVGTAINVAFRLLESGPLRQALADSSGVIAVIASQWIFDEVIRHDPASDTALYRRVPISVKETQDTAWICRPDDPYPPRETAVLAAPRQERNEPRNGGGFPGIVTVAPPVGRLDRPVRGRESLLAALKRLVGEPDSGVHVLYGMGGCGKTTIALELAAHATARGVDVWWVTAADLPMLSAGMREVVACLGASADLIERAWSGRTSAIDLLWRLLAATATPWLLVVDNADEPENLAPAAGYLAEGTGWIRPCASLPGMVLITSRDGNRSRWGAWSVLHQVDALGEDDAAQVLLDRAGDDAGPRSDAVLLARRLGGLPLALRIVGAYLSATSSYPDWPGTRSVRTYADYWAALDDRFIELLSEQPSGGAMPGPAAPGSAAPMGQTWELSLDLLERRGIDKARSLMRLLSCLGEAPVPYLRVLRPDLLASSELFAGLTADRLSAALLALGDLGLIEFHTAREAADAITARTLLVHPLVRDANRHQQDLAEHRMAYASLVADLLVAAASGLGAEDPADWPLWRLLIPHCDSALELIIDSADAEPGVLAQALRAAVAGVQHLVTIGWLDQAEAILETCQRAVDGPGPLNPDVLAVRSCTASLLQSRGRLAESETLLRAVLADTRAIFHEDSPEAVDARYALAELLDYRGRMAEAEEEFRAVLAARGSSLGPEHPQTLAARKGVARMSRQRGLLREAEDEYRLVLVAYRDCLGDRHPATLATRHDLALVLHERGLFRQAEEELRGALGTCDEVLGPQHPSTLAMRHDLADVLRARGLLKEAEIEFRAVLDLRRTALGEGHPATVAARYGLATVLRDRGRPGAAEHEFREVLEIRRELLGDGHPSTLAVRHGLADLLMERGLLEEAEAEFREVYQARRAVLGEEHLLTLSVRHGAARVLQLRGRPEQAELEYRSVLADCVDVLGARHPGTLAVRHGLADLLMERGALEEAEGEFREVYQARRAVLGEEHLLTLSVRHGAACVLRLRGRPEEAELEYRSVLADCVDVLGARHPGTLAVRHGRADLLMERGRVDEAKAEFDEVYQTRRTVLGEEHPATLAAREALSRVARQQVD